MVLSHEELKYTDLIALMKRSDCEELILKEHRQILREKINGTFEVSNMNQGLNRYLEPVCFDHSRVILPIEKNRGSYINANYVDGFSYKKKFICTQAPLECSSYDFWRMIWMERTQIIVMLCQINENGKEKCHSYWSNVEQSCMMIKKFKIFTTKIERFPDYIKTSLLLTDGTDASQEITHFNFIAWPDFGVPEETEFFNFMLKVRQSHDEIYRESLKNGHSYCQPPPIVVHCSAGLGRTPCYCAIDIAISSLFSTRKVCLASIVSRIRKQRKYCIFMPSQYYFCYQVMKLYIDSTMTEDSGIRKAVRLFKKVISCR